MVWRETKVALSRWEVHLTKGTILLQYMYDENPGKIDFGSNERKFQVSEASSFRESTVLTLSGHTDYL